MSAVLKLCQERYDAQLPPEVSESDELNDWLEHSAERLVCGAAFPQSGFGKWAPECGMTLRDYFAAQAMTGLMGRSWAPLAGDDLVRQWAISAYAMADAMLAARSA